MRRAVFLAALVLALAPAAPGRGDEVVLANGDRLSGKVLRTEDGRLVLRTEHSGEVKIDKSKVVRITTEEAVELHLEGGEVLKGRLRSGKDG